jgi:hopanoid biosynthesis associated radical SAM protein HpnH
MRFPLSLTRSMATYLLRKKLAGEKRFPLVLMLEPLHACNLSCAGCGRIREYADTMHRRLTLERCLAAAAECGAPIVSICGGEPLLYPDIENLVDRLISNRKHVYLCTNGVLLEKKLRGFRPSSSLSLNVHIDGMEASHDRMVRHAGAFAAAVRGILDAKVAGFHVCTNTTIYRETDMHEIVVLFRYLEEMGVDGFMISPAYGYEAVRDGDPQGGRALFMTRQEVHEKFRAARELLRGVRLNASPIYLRFLCGERELPCAAWANPTYNVRGWRGPCYLVSDSHYETYRELVDATDWDRLGPGGDPRCAHCLVHSGFEPAAVLSAHKGFADVLRMAVWQMT